MVNHDHDRIKVVEQRKVHNEVHGEILERVGVFKHQGSDGEDDWMGKYLVCLADCISRDEFSDIGGEARPPIILRQECNCLQVVSMASFEGAVGTVDQVMASDLWYVEAVLKVEAFIIECLILSTESVEEGEFLFHLVDCLENQRTTRRGVFYFVSKSYVNSLELLVEGVGGEELDVYIVQGDIHVISMG